MFNITKAHIQQLNDADLRELIGHLCEAEVEQFGISPKCVIWGGTQTTPDGGTDVSVNASEAPPHGFIPHAHTVFQVKKNAMPPSAIEKEMCPKGKVRPLISSLSQSAGAYIIVSSGDDASAKMKKDRVKKMEDILSSNNLTKIVVDFYDCQQIATWVNTLPSVVIWMQSKVSTITSGWYPYGNWSNQVGGIDAEYIVDEKARIEFEGRPYSTVDGINLIRSKLRNREKSIRIVGVSGVGKTRFLQALFDDRIGEDALAKSTVIYTDTSYAPTPSPNAIVEFYLKTNKSIIVVIDNCPATLHKALTDICLKGQGSITVVTVEYDISDNDPEETAFFRIATHSKEAIYQMLPSWSEALTHDLADKIYELSDGNARLAKVLCTAIKKHGHAVSLSDEEFFKRIFWQGNNENTDLLKVAEACSLVYSFGVEGEESAEASVLASIAEVSEASFKRYVAELKKRDVIQARGKWRAFLPHALANRISEGMLMHFEPSVCNLLSEDSKRLFRSFIRRLSYVYTNEKAVKLAKALIKNMDVQSFEYQNADMEAFSRLASIVPEDALAIIESNIENLSGRYWMHDNYISRILVFIAYDPELFNRAVNLLVSFYLDDERPAASKRIIEQSLMDLFGLRGSGTLAPPIQRKAFIKGLIHNVDINHQLLGAKLLSSTLDMGRRRYIVSNPYSQRQRCNGYYPNDKAEWVGWFEQFLSLFAEIVTSHSQIFFHMLNQNDYRWRLLFRNINLDAITISFCEKIREHFFWPQGLIDAEEALLYAKDPSPDEDVDIEVVAKSKKILRQIIAVLKPKSDVEFLILYQVEDSYHLNKFGYLPEVEDDVKKIVIERAKSVAEQGEFNSHTMRYFVSAQNMSSLDIGRGICMGFKRPEVFLQQFYEVVSDVPRNDIRIGVLLGFLDELKISNPQLCDETVLSMSNIELMFRFYPTLLSYLSNENIIKNLKTALDNKNIPVYAFYDVWRSQGFRSLPVCKHTEFYKSLCQKPGGTHVAVDTFHMHYYREMEESRIPPDAIKLGQYLLLAFNFCDDYSDNLDHGLATIFKACSIDWDAKNFVQNLCAYFEKTGLTHNFSDLLDKVVKSRPILFLDVFLYDGEELSLNLLCARFYENYNSVINEINDDTIMDWILINKDERCIKVAKCYCLFAYKESGVTWLPIFERLISSHSEPLDIVEIAFNSLIPMSWSGSLADIMESRSKLIEDLCRHENQVVQSYASEYLCSFKLRIEAERKWEAEKDRECAWENERFE